MGGGVAEDSATTVHAQTRGRRQFPKYHAEQVCGQAEREIRRNVGGEVIGACVGGEKYRLPLNHVA